MKNIIFCDGGLANRLNTLISGFYLAEKIGGAWEVSWPQNDWCGARLISLFDIDIPIINNKLDYYANYSSKYFFLFHEDQLKFKPENTLNVRDLRSFNSFKVNLPIFYYNNLIPDFMDDKAILNALNKIRVRKNIENIVKKFCNDNLISEQIIGLHIRKTDFGNAVDDEALKKMVDGHSRKFFICTDDKNVADKFKRLSNCILFEHESYVEKRMIEVGWNSIINDDVGRVYPFNVKRSSDSVINALIELIILSKTTLVDTSNSTFLSMAKIFKKYEYCN